MKIILILDLTLSDQEGRVGVPTSVRDQDQGIKGRGTILQENTKVEVKIKVIKVIKRDKVEITISNGRSQSIAGGIKLIKVNID